MAENIMNIQEVKETKEMKTEKQEQLVITIVRTHIPYSKMMDFVDTIVRLSFDAEGKYHRYLKDYAEALVVLEAYTDYVDDKEKQDYDTIMAIRHSALWDKQIIPAIQHDYDVMSIYLDDEVERATAPFANISKTLNNIGNAAGKVLEIANALNITSLGELDVSELQEALEKVNSKE